MPKPRRRYSWGSAAIFALLLISAAPFLNGQAVSVIRSGSFEIGGFAGASYGIDKTRVMGGGNVTFAINKWILPYAEFSYFPGIGRTEDHTFPGTGNPYKLHYSVPMSDFHAGVHVRFPIREKPIVPYLVFGLGGLHSYADTVSSTYNVSPTVTQSTPPLPVGSSTNFAINGGGGVRVYLGQRFGVRVEAKAYRPTGDLPGQFANTSASVFGKVEGGFFFQLR